VAVLSFEKSSYILKQELSFLPDRLSVESEPISMITNRQNTKIQLALTIFVGSNRTLVVRTDPNGSRTEPNRTRIEKVQFVSASERYQ
jgi:hypothetical protein